MGTPLTRHDAVMDMISAYDRYNDGSIELPNVLDQILMTMMTTARSMGWVKRQELRPLNLGFDQEVVPAHTSAGRVALPPLNLGFYEGGVTAKDLRDGDTLPAAGTEALRLPAAGTEALRLPAAGTAALHPLNLGFDQEVLPAHTSASRVALPPLNLGFREGGVTAKDLGDDGALPAAGTAALRPLNLGFDQEVLLANASAGRVAVGTGALLLNLGYDQEALPANISAGKVALRPINLGFHENVPANNTEGGVAWPALHLGFDRPASAQTMLPLNLGFDEETVLPMAWLVPRPLNFKSGKLVLALLDLNGSKCK
jgi:hypothetical protein